MMPRRSTSKATLVRVESHHADTILDQVAVEEPLEIRLRYFNQSLSEQKEESISITMRTPGDDFELAAGFLFTEGIIENREAIDHISYCLGHEKSKQAYNIVTVTLQPQIRCDLARLKRHFYLSSSCGVCGKSSLDALALHGCQALSDQLSLTSEHIVVMPALVRSAQSAFEKTGGLHAAALFDTKGRLLSLKEDVGRHNALDKLIGEALLSNKTSLPSTAVMVSGRTSFELVQKALLARIPIVVAIGAPSSLAIELAKEFNITLIGFLRENKFNIYSGAHRISLAASVSSPISTSA
jgi:FdhD protein